MTVLPTLTAFIAFILSTLCLFAGTRTNLIPDTDILTLYTPFVGNGSEVADFYSVYVMSYCEGLLGVTDDGSIYRQNFTSCSRRTALFSFDPAEVLLKEKGNTTSLDSLGWPDAISGDFHAFSLTSRVMAIFYCIGAGAVGLTMVARFWILVTKGPRQSVFEVACLMASFVCLSISSIIATVYAFQFVDLVNSHGKESEVTADYGVKFLGMTWTAVGLVLLGSAVSLSMVLVDHRRRADLESWSKRKQADPGSGSIRSSRSRL